MDASLRATGIQAIGDIAWGTHICNFYRSPEDLAETLVPYFKAGLDSNEVCLWITSPPLRTEDARAALAAAVPRLADRVAAGQIELIDYRDWYTRTGRFDENDVMALWLARERQAIERGYGGLRVTGNSFWIDDADGFRAFTDYEARLNEVIGGHLMLVMCSYSTTRCECEDVFDVVRAHQLALVRRRGQWEVIEDAPLKIAKEELRRLNAELESRVLVRTEQLAEALRARDDFLCMASHELRTPLAALQLQLEGLLRQGELDTQKTRERIGRTLGHGRRLGALVQRMLDVSRVEAGEIDIERAPCALAEIVREVLRRHEARLDAAGMAVTTRIEAEPIGRWDRARLGQVLENLLSNALKFAAGQPIEIDVGVDDAGAILRVRDHGPGIPPRERERIFERFVQLGPTRHAQGFGLGLWIARRIVEAHGGSIREEGAFGDGASFLVRLPLDAAGEA